MTSNSLHDMLKQWYPLRDSSDWVMGTIYKTAGSSYRKPGAMMMLSSSSMHLGLLSGGCLESDIILQAKKAMFLNEPILVRYDGTDEDDLSYRLGIGCGGVVDIIFQSVNSNNQYLQLDTLHNALRHRHAAVYRQQICSATRAHNTCSYQTQAKSKFNTNHSKIISIDNKPYLENYFYPRPHLLVCGGSFDARSLVSIASQLGWEVSVWDPRPANARHEHFGSADNILKAKELDFSAYVNNKSVDAIVVMTHNIDLDASVLRQTIDSNVGYIGVLGPLHRKEHLIEHAKLTHSPNIKKLQGPIGIEIGAQLPETIALSVLAQIHQQLYLSSPTLSAAGLPVTLNLEYACSSLL